MTQLPTSNQDDYDSRDAGRNEAHTSPTTSNGDLYYMTPPMYSEVATQHESSVDAEAMVDEKPREPTPLYAPPTSTATGSDRREFVDDEEPATRITTSSTEDTDLLSVRRCSILPNRPAAWLVKRRNLALSQLAAAVLTKKGLIKFKDLELNSKVAAEMRDPNNPFSGVVVGTYDAVGDILGSLVTGPIEGGKYVAQRHAKQEGTKLEKIPCSTSSVRQNSAPLIPDDANTRSTESASRKPPADPSPSEGRIMLEEEREPDSLGTALDTASNTAKDIAVGTGIGLGRIVGAGLKAPMSITHGLTRGFHNLPKLYGDEVREYEVTDLKSGLEVSAKSFGYGISDGLKDFFVQPVIGARKEGGKGFIKGFGKGMGNVVCKPTAGACGLVSYSFVGAYKQLQAAVPKSSERGTEEAEALKALGEAEYNETPEQTRVEVVRRWCQIKMEGDHGS